MRALLCLAGALFLGAVVGATEPAEDIASDVRCSAERRCAHNGTCDTNSGYCSCLLGYGGTASRAAPAAPLPAAAAAAAL